MIGTAVRWVAALATTCLLAASCSEAGTRRPISDKNTNWLGRCAKSSECAPGLECLAHCCTRVCTNAVNCSSLRRGAICVTPATSDVCPPSGAGTARICSLACDETHACPQSDLACVAGACVAAVCAPEGGAPDAGHGAGGSGPDAARGDGGSQPTTDPPDARAGDAARSDASASETAGGGAGGGRSGADGGSGGNANAAGGSGGTTGAGAGSGGNAGQTGLAEDGGPNLPPTVVQYDMLPVWASALVADRARQRFYATSTGGSYTNELVTIDAKSKTVIGAVPIGPRPETLALSDDGSTLWVGVSLTHELVRVDLTTGTATPAQRFTFPSAQSGTASVPTYAHALLVLPGTSRSVIASLGQDGSGKPDFDNVAVFDDGVPRATTSRSFPDGPTRFTAGPSGTVFGYGDYSDFYTFAIDAGGVTRTTNDDVRFTNSYDIFLDGGLLYGGSQVFDVTNVAAPRRAGEFDYAGPSVRADDGTLRMLTLDTTNQSTPLVLRTLDPGTMTQVRVNPFQNSGGQFYSLTHLAYVPPGILAFVGSHSPDDNLGVYLFDDPPDPRPRPPRITPVRHGNVLEVPLSATSLVADTARNRLYAVVRGNEPAHPNELVTIDGATGAILGATFIGSYPWTAAISDDASTLWVSLFGADSLRRVDLSTPLPTPGKEYPLPSNPNFGLTYAAEVNVLPGTRDSLLVSLAYEFLSPSFAGLFVLDNGVPRPNSTPGHTGPSDITLGPAGYAFGFGDAFYTIKLDAAGASQTSFGALFSGVVYKGLSYSDGFVYSLSGGVVDARDPNAPKSAGVLSSTGAVVPIPAAHAVIVVSHVTGGSTALALHKFDGQTLAETGSVALDTGAPSGFEPQVVYLGKGRVAFIARLDVGISTIYLVEDALIP